MLVGVDLCNTIQNINLELVKYYRLDFCTYPFKNVSQDFFETATGNQVFMNASPFPGARELLRDLTNNSGVRIEYVTNRPRTADFVTRRWLALHGFPPGRIIFTRKPEDKVDYILKRGITLLFEDDPRVVTSIKKHYHSIDIFLKDWQYNRSVRGINRFRKWSDLVGPSGVSLGL